MSDAPGFWLLLGYAMIPAALMLIVGGVVMGLLHPLETLTTGAPVLAAFVLGFETGRRGR